MLPHKPMSYDLQIENVSPIKRRLRFTVPQETVNSELNTAYEAIKDQARLPGFRKGKVPRNILEARFGKQVRGDVSNRLVSQSWSQEAEKFNLAGQPRLKESNEVSSRTDFIFTIEIDIRPDVAVDGYKGVEIPYRVATVSDDEISAEIERLLKGQARIEEVTDDRPVEAGDFVQIELVLKDGDEELAREAGTMVNTASERYYPGVEELLLGMSRDEEKSGTVTIGEGSIFEHLRGKSLEATAKVLSIQANRVPALSDEIAESMGYEGGADAMRAAIQMKLQQSRDEAARNQARVDLLQKLVDANSFDVPDGMVSEQLNALVEELRVRRAYGGQDPRSIRFSDKEMEDLRQRATFAAKASCILDAVARQESIEATDDDVNARIEEIAGMRGQTAEAIRGYLAREGAFDVLRDRILEEKTLEWLLERADLKHEEISEDGGAEASSEEAPAAE